MIFIVLNSTFNGIDPLILLKNKEPKEIPIKIDCGAIFKRTKKH
ncbi:MAG: hypothetical protein ACI8ZX_001404 [Planctomycetota bacterium]|jgi:hypothetical protein